MNASTPRRPASARRNLLLGGLGATGAALALPLRANAATVTEQGPRKSPAGARLLADPALDYSALTALGMAAYGVSEVGEVLTAIGAVNANGAGNESYTEAFLGLADRLAQESADASNRVTRGEKALRASQYYAQALFYVLGTRKPGRELDVYRACRQNWDIFSASVRPAAERLAIPYGNVRLPGWFFRPDTANRRRPTVILTNGSDGQAVDLWSWGAAAALERGWNALIYDGPGQGAALFEQKLPFTTHWEHVVTPIVDRLVRHPQVDPRRIALTGLSMGGNLAPRAAAFEHRLAAVVAEPGIVSPWSAFPEGFRKIVGEDKDETNKIWNSDVVPALGKPEMAEARFMLAKRYEPFGSDVLDAVRQGRLATDIWTPSQAVQQLDITTVAARIEAPTLVLDYDDEQFYPKQAKQLFSLLRARKDYVKMTAGEGANFHCSPMAPRRHNEVIFDWLEKTVR